MANKLLVKAEQVARAEIGYREGPKNNETKFGSWFGMNFVAWCAIFQSWISAISGTTYLGKPWRFASTISARDHAKKNKRWSTQPTVGTIAMMAHSSTTGHVGWVIALLRSATGGIDVVTIEGNTNDQGAREGNGVWLRRRSASSWDGYIALDQTFAQDAPEEEDDMKQRFYKIRDEAHIDKPHPTKGEAIWVTDGTESKFVNGAAWEHEKNLGWWDESQVELIPEDLHNWLISDSSVTIANWVMSEIKKELADPTLHGGTGQISPEVIDSITKSILDAQYKRMKE